MKYYMKGDLPAPGAAPPAAPAAGGKPGNPPIPIPGMPPAAGAAGAGAPQGFGTALVCTSVGASLEAAVLVAPA